MIMQRHAGVSKLRPGQFEFLSAAVTPAARVLEVGTLHGVTAAKLAGKHPNARVLSVDIFVGVNPECWLANHRSNQTLFVGMVQDLAALQPAVRFDVIFVDADHRYEPCKRDLKTALTLLAPGGRLFAHDYGQAADWKWPGVTRAVDELCAEHGLRVIGRETSLVEIGP